MEQESSGELSYVECHLLYCIAIRIVFPSEGHFSALEQSHACACEQSKAGIWNRSKDSRVAESDAEAGAGARELARELGSALEQSHACACEQSKAGIWNLSKDDAILDTRSIFQKMTRAICQRNMEPIS
jgi:hypothetical protein